MSKLSDTKEWALIVWGIIVVFALSIGSCKLLTIRYPAYTECDRIAVILFFIISFIFWFAPIIGIARSPMNDNK